MMTSFLCQDLLIPLAADCDLRFLPHEYICHVFYSENTRCFYICSLFCTTEVLKRVVWVTKREEIQRRATMITPTKASGSTECGGSVDGV